MKGWIRIVRLAVPARIGVLEEEKDRLQTLEVTVAMQPGTRFEEMRDDVSRTIDYAEVASRIRALAKESHRDLLESLAVAIREMLCNEFDARAVEIEIRKFVLPDAAYVSVCDRWP